jgi:hypothetical protein
MAIDKDSLSFSLLVEPAHASSMESLQATNLHHYLKIEIWPYKHLGNEMEQANYSFEIGSRMRLLFRSRHTRRQANHSILRTAAQ